MRIISGIRRGAHLIVPEGGAVRPTADRTREGLFNLLDGGRYGAPLKARIVADIFAGCGSLGLEAWSRGAGQVVFVENNVAACAALAANIEKLGCTDAVHIIRCDAIQEFVWDTASVRSAAKIWPAAPAELIFLDPPWRGDEATDLAARALANLMRMGAVAEDALISIEHDHRRPPMLPAGVVLLEMRRWGKSACSLARYEG